MSPTERINRDQHWKDNSRRAKQTRNESRRWCIPPAVMREESETLEFSAMLGEHPDGQAYLLWQALRDVTLLASVEPEQRERRAGLFKAEAADRRREEINRSALEVRIAMNLTALTSVVASPSEVSAEMVMMLCMDTSAWAEDRGAMATAIAFAQAAALIEPEAPGPAARVGHLAHGWGRHTRAETWLRRAVGLARRSKDWEVYGYACVALANLYAARNQGVEPQQAPAADHAHPGRAAPKRTPARQYAILAMRLGRRHGIPQVRGVALHTLCRLSMAAGKFKEANLQARAALRALGRGHASVPDLMLDIAYLMVLDAQFDRAVAYLKRLSVGVPDRARRARVLAILARAAAGAAVNASGTSTAEAAKETYRQAWSDAWMLITEQSPKLDEASASTLLELTRAAALLRDHPRLEKAARRDRDVAPNRTSRSAAAYSDILQGLVKVSRRATRDG